MRVAVRVRLEGVEAALLLEILHGAPPDGGRVTAGQPADPLEVVAVLVERCHDREPDRLAELVVLSATTGRDVDDARALFLADLVPGNDSMLVTRAAVIGTTVREGRLDGG